MNYSTTKQMWTKVAILSLLCIACTCLAPMHAQESCYEQYLREHNKKMLTAEDADDSYDELKKTVLAKQMYGDSYLLKVDTIAQRVKLTKVDGTYIADVHLALVDSTWYMWLSVDPLADQNIQNSPYMYCNGNPIMMIDPDGKQVILHGAQRKTAYYQLLQNTSLEIQMHRGTLSVENPPEARTLSPKDNMLLNAICNPNIIVNLYTVKGLRSHEGYPFAAGAFGGNRSKAGTVRTSQTVNPLVCSLVEDYVGMPKGTIMMHEVLESYLGAIHQTDVFYDDNPQHRTEYFKVYEWAHSQANILDPKHDQDYSVRNVCDVIILNLGHGEPEKIIFNIPITAE